MHYEVEQAGAAASRPRRRHPRRAGRWHVVNVFNADAVPIPLTFDTIWTCSRRVEG